MNVTNPQVEAPAKAVAAARYPKDPKAVKTALEEAEEILLTLESLALGARAMLGAAVPKSREDGRQLNRARLIVSPLPELARGLASSVGELPAGLSLEQLACSRRAIDEFGQHLNRALNALQAIDSHGDLVGAGASTIHADMILDVALKELIRAEACLEQASEAYVFGRAGGRA